MGNGQPPLITHQLQGKAQLSAMIQTTQVTQMIQVMQMLQIPPLILLHQNLILIERRQPLELFTSSSEVRLYTLCQRQVVLCMGTLYQLGLTAFVQTFQTIFAHGL